jgi:hypothetical protein
MCENIIVYGDYTPLTANNLQDYRKAVDLLNTAKKIVNSCTGFYVSRFHKIVILIERTSHTCCFFGFIVAF